MSFLPAYPLLRHLSDAQTGQKTKSGRTTVRLEAAWWTAIDALANKKRQTWREWVADALADRPTDVGAAAWLRLAVLRDAGARLLKGA